MATVYPAASGNWSTITWMNDATGAAYGQLPQTGDAVLSSGKTVTIDQNISVASLGNVAGTNAIAGGSFTCTSARTITVSGNVSGGTATCLNLSATSATITVTCAQAVGSSSTGSVRGIITSGGDVNGIYNITCTPIPGSQGGSFGLIHSSTGTLNLTGNCNGSGAVAAVSNTSTGTINITGSTTAGSATNGNGLTNSSSGAVTVSGSVTGGSGNGAYGIQNASTGVVTVAGTVTGGSAASAFGINNASTGQIICNGPVVASTTSPAIMDVAAQAGFIYVSAGPIINSTGINAIAASHLAIGQNVIWTVAKAGTPPTYNGTVTLTAGNQPYVTPAKYIADFDPAAVVRFSFNTRDGSGNLITLGGTPVVMIYKSGNTTEVATGVTLTVDYDSRTGYHHVFVDMSTDGTFYSAGSDFRAVLTAGTVSGVSIANTEIAHWSINNRGTQTLRSSAVDAVAAAILVTPANKIANGTGGKVAATLSSGDMAANTIGTTQFTSAVQSQLGRLDAAVTTRATPSDVSQTINFSPTIYPTTLDTSERAAIADSVWTRSAGRTLTGFGTLIFDIVTALQEYMFGTGTRAIDFLVTDADGNPIEAAIVNVLQNGILKAFALTEADGHPASPLGINDGSYKVPVSADGFNPRVIDMTVTQAGTVEIVLTRIAITPSPPNTVTGWLIATLEGVPTTGLRHTLTIDNPPEGGTGASYESESRTSESAESGLVQFTGLRIGSSCTIQRGNGRRFSFVVPDPSPNADFEIVDSIGPSA